MFFDNDGIGVRNDATKDMNITGKNDIIEILLIVLGDVVLMGGAPN